MAGLDFNAFTSEADVARRIDVWRKASEKLSTGKMPPPGEPVAAKTEVAAVTEWIEGFIAGNDARSPQDSGRITARRLSRVEYGNTNFDSESS
jgi:hypothetical protein